MQHGFDARVAEIQKENHQREITLEQAIQNGDDRIQDTKRYKKALMIVLREIDTISNSDICDTSKNLYLSKSCFKVCRQ